MRSRFLVFICMAVLLVAVLLFWWHPAQPPAKTEQAPAPVQSTSPPVASTGFASVTPLVARSTVQAKPQSGIATNSETRRQAIIEQFIAQKSGPVDFYGKFIDQDSNALSGVNIKVSILQLTMPVPTVGVPVGSKEIYIERTSDSDGRVEINGKTGASVSVESIQKDGYDPEPWQHNFGYLSGSYENPVTFKMWSTNIHEKLIEGNKSFQIKPDGRPYFINLTDDTISESGAGDLKVWIQYTNQVVFGQNYDWSAGIVVINGGLLEEPIATPMLQAPTEGYIPEFRISDQIRGGQRGETGDRQFYVQLKNGQEYGQISINLLAPFNVGIPGLVRLSYAINPSGSRILR